MSDLHLPLSIVLGVGLAAATRFRVFLPMLVVGVAAYTGHLPLDGSFAWLATPSANGGPERPQMVGCTSGRLTPRWTRR